jgi:heavy metal efflux system protein
MTALVAALGFVPMAFATGTRAEVQKPLATVVIGGLISATLLTLAILPALYARYGRAAVQPSSRATPAISPQPSP